MERHPRKRRKVFRRTLTLGKLKVLDIVSINDFERKEVLKFAALAESRSSHPIGTAIVNEAKQKGLNLDIQVDVLEVAGKGVKATLQGGRTILVGRPSFLEENGIDIDTSQEDQTQTDGIIISVAVDGKLAGLIVVADEPRPEAKETVEALKALGIERVVMLTGDNEATAEKIAEKLGITNYHAALLPEHKVQLAYAYKEKYGSIVMVGDGINDAPVLATSNVGIAIGTAGNDIAIEATDVALMDSDLRAVPYVIKLGRKVVSKLKTNIVLTLSLKFFMITLGVLGLIPLWFTVIRDDGITLVVIANALLLLRFKR